jgi:hypothetical protein
MKQLWTAFLVSTFVAPTAFAQFTATEMVEATRLATEDFGRQAPASAAKVWAIKVWQDGEDSRVKFYYLDDSNVKAEATYLCHKHDNLLECHI